jgi:hypothetical protein
LEWIIGYSFRCKTAILLSAAKTIENFKSLKEIEENMETKRSYLRKGSHRTA